MKNKKIIESIFKDFIHGDHMYIENNPTMSEYQYITVDDFCNVFADVEDITLNKLIITDVEKELGYSEFFSKVKSHLEKNAT